MKNRLNLSRTATESGQFPKPDLSTFASQEAPESKERKDKQTKRENSDPASITGVLPVVSEGEDRAKQRDDSAAGH